jgi:site-specific DNA-cytosine methylase
LAHPESTDHRMVLELFAGTGNLSAAARRAGLPVMTAEDVRTGPEFDLLQADHYRDLKKLLRLGRVRWLHGAPPCQTF